MTMLQKVPALLVGFACALALTACDGGDGGDSGGESGGDDRNATILGLEGNATAGGGVFSGNSCASEACHGADGISGMAPSLATTVPNLSDESIVSTLLNGKGSMPSQAALTDQQLADVLAYVSDTFGG